MQEALQQNIADNHSCRPMTEIRHLTVDEAVPHLDTFADILIDCVEGGASVHFMPPLSHTTAVSFFRNVVADVRQGNRVLLGAFVDGAMVGTVQVQLAMPPNQPHRAEIAKLLVHRSARNHGVGALLMEHAEKACREAGKTLLVLDTQTGGAAERLYQRMGWTTAGVIPNFALLPDGSLCGTTILWKQLP